MGESRARRGAGKAKVTAQASSQAAAADGHTQPTHRRYLLAAGGAVLAAGLAWAGGAFNGWASQARSEPKVYGFRVVRVYDHDPKAFTQGLLWSNGSLFESTGLYGKSEVRELRLNDEQGTADVVRQTKLGPKDFGEGLVQWRGQLLQLLWRKGEGIRYYAKAGEDGYLKKAKRFRTPLSDGWGLESDGKSLLFTDSGSKIFYVDPETFNMQREVTVNDNGVDIEMVNELEMVGQELWANIFGNECLARIDPGSGSVTGWVTLNGILDRQRANAEAAAANRDPPDVLNGIAWDKERQRLFVTGKLWPKLYEIEITEAPAGFTLQRARELCIPKVNIFRQR